MPDTILHSPPPKRGRPLGTAAAGRVRTLDHVGRMLCTMGLASRPLKPDEVAAIERRALRKIKRRLAIGALPPKIGNLSTLSMP